MQCKINKKNAMTLAEVLITLGIIGVVAALTIPTLINNIQEKSYLTSFQKVYTNLSQAYIQAAQENGNARGWSLEDSYNYMKPFFKLTKDCGFSTPCQRPSEVKDINGVGQAGAFPDYHLILADGSIIYFWYIQVTDKGGSAFLNNLFDNFTNSVVLVVDTNGLKEPNKLGYDIFFLTLATKQNAPIVLGGVPSWNFLTPQICTKGEVPAWYSGGSCAFWIYRHGNMDYLHRDITSEW